MFNLSIGRAVEEVAAAASLRKGESSSVSTKEMQSNKSGGEVSNAEAKLSFAKGRQSALRDKFASFADTDEFLFMEDLRTPHSYASESLHTPLAPSPLISPPRVTKKEIDDPRHQSVNSLVPRVDGELLGVSDSLTNVATFLAIVSNISLLEFPVPCCYVEYPWKADRWTTLLPWTAKSSDASPVRSELDGAVGDGACQVSRRRSSIWRAPEEEKAVTHLDGPQEICLAALLGRFVLEKTATPTARVSFALRLIGPCGRDSWLDPVRPHEVESCLTSFATSTLISLVERHLTKKVTFKVLRNAKNSQHLVLTSMRLSDPLLSREELLRRWQSEGAVSIISAAFAVVVDLRNTTDGKWDFRWMAKLAALAARLAWVIQQCDKQGFMAIFLMPNSFHELLHAADAQRREWGIGGGWTTFDDLGFLKQLPEVIRMACCHPKTERDEWNGIEDRVPSQGLFGPLSPLGPSPLKLESFAQSMTNSDTQLDKTPPFTADADFPHISKLDSLNKVEGGISPVISSPSKMASDPSPLNFQTPMENDNSLLLGRRFSNRPSDGSHHSGYSTWISPKSVGWPRKKSSSYNELRYIIFSGDHNELGNCEGKAKESFLDLASSHSHHSAAAVAGSSTRRSSVSRRRTR